MLKEWVRGSHAVLERNPNYWDKPKPYLDRMIIRTVTMTIAAANVQDTFKQVEQLAAEQGGYLAGTQMRQDGDRWLISGAETSKMSQSPVTRAYSKAA